MKTFNPSRLVERRKKLRKTQMELARETGFEQHCYFLYRKRQESAEGEYP